MTKKKKVLVIVAVSLAALLLIVGVLNTVLFIKETFVYFGEEDREYFLEKIRYLSGEVVTEGMPEIEIERINLKNSLIQEYTEIVDRHSYRFMKGGEYLAYEEHMNMLADDIARLTPEKYARRYVRDKMSESLYRLISHSRNMHKYGQEYVASHHLDEEKLREAIDRYNDLSWDVVEGRISIDEAKQLFQEINSKNLKSMLQMVL